MLPPHSCYECCREITENRTIMTKFCSNEWHCSGSWGASYWANICTFVSWLLNEWIPWRLQCRFFSQVILLNQYYWVYFMCILLYIECSVIVTSRRLSILHSQLYCVLFDRFTANNWFWKVLQTSKCFNPVVSLKGAMYVVHRLLRFSFPSMCYF